MIKHFYYFPHHRATPVSLSPVIGYTSLGLVTPTKYTSQPKKMSFFSHSPMTQKQCKVRFPQLHDPQNKVLSCNLQNMCFISTSTPCPKTTPVSFRSAQWPHKILHTLPSALCPQQIYLTTHQRWVSFPSATWPKNNVKFVSLSSMTP